MEVTFRKSGARRYGVVVVRHGAPTLAMDPAPGYDDDVPHDLMHFVVEAEWGIDGGVFGQLAAGGDAGTFWPVDQELLRKWSRRRKRSRVRFEGGRRAEALAAVVESAWNARHCRGPAVPAELDPERLEHALETLDGLARRWRALQVGGSITLEWPRRAVRPATTRGSSRRTAARAFRPRGS
jgi:hypothetical protein